MILEHQSYRTCLKVILAERIAKNSRYSLRAMARSVGLQAPVLSEVLKGKRNLSIDNAFRVADRLEFTPEEKDYFCTLVQYETCKTPALKASLETRLEEMRGGRQPARDLSIDAFHSIAKWYHIAILQLFDTGSPVTDELIAARLGTSIHEARDALDRLERLDLVEKNSRGIYQRLHDKVSFATPIPNSALRQYHRTYLEKAIECLETQTNDEKFVGTETLALSPKRLKEAERLIEDCFRKIIALAAKDTVREEVYHVGIHAFRVTKPKEKRK